MRTNKPSKINYEYENFYKKAFFLFRFSKVMYPLPGSYVWGRIRTNQSTQH